jgi:hypothetical protein
MVRKGSASSIPSSLTRGNNSTKEALSTPADVGRVEGVLPLLEKLCATIDTMAARLDRLEGAYFNAARGPADPGVVGSTSIKTPTPLVQSAQNSGFADTARGGMMPSSASLPGDPSPQTVVDYVDAPLCGYVPSVQLFKPGADVACNSNSGSFALEDTFTLEGGHDDKDAKLDGSDAPPSLTISDDDIPILRIQAFLRRSFVRFRLRRECGIADYHALQSHVLIAVRSWYVPAPPRSKSSTRHLAAARVIAGFVQRDVIKWLLARRRLSRRHAVRLVQKWFRGIRYIRRALYAFEPFVTRHLGWSPDVPSWCIHRVHVAWVLTGPNEWSQWIFSFKHMAATAGQLGASDLPPVSTGIRLRQMQEFGGCRRWPWPQSYHPSAFQMQLPRREIVSYHSLISPLHARAFWYNADNLLKVGVRRSQGVVVPHCLLRWVSGLAPDVSPPAKVDWRRGASRRRRRSVRGCESLHATFEPGATPSGESILCVTDNGDGNGAADHQDDVNNCDGGYANADGMGDDHDDYVDNDEGRSGVHDDRHGDQHDDDNDDVQHNNQCNGDMHTNDDGDDDYANGDDHDNYVGGNADDDGDGRCDNDRDDDHNDRGDY